MRLIFFVLLFIPLITISCIDKKFEKELKLVESVLNNPDNIINIIRESELYHPHFFVLNKFKSIDIIQYLEVERSESEIECSIQTVNMNNIIFNNAKVVSIFQKKSENYLVFNFCNPWPNPDSSSKLFEIKLIKSNNKKD
jgi:hypothetical protein